MFDTINTLNERIDYRLGRIVSIIRHSFESQELDIMRWLTGKENMAHALTKRNMAQYIYLNDFFGSGIWKVKMDDGKMEEGSIWT